MKKYIVLPAIAVSGIAGLIFAASAQALPLPAATATASPSATPSPSVSPGPSVTPEPSITPSPEPEPEPGSEVTVDIFVALDLPNSERSEGPMEWDYRDIPVTDGVELVGQPATANPSGWCGDITVDVSADLTEVAITGGEDYCDFEEALVQVYLHGYNFTSIDLESDTLFGTGEEDGVLRGSTFGGAGRGALSNALRLAVVEQPTLQYAVVEGPLFEAYWLGTSSYQMSGEATFSVSAEEAAAEGAEPVAGEPTFAG